MAIMVYFKDENGAELPFSGYAFAWCGSHVGGRQNRAQIEVTRGKKRYMLTSDSFNAERVFVKVWAPAGYEHWKLVPGPVQQIHDLPTEWVKAEKIAA